MLGLLVNLARPVLPEWPEWTIYTLAIMVSVLCFSMFLTSLQSPSASTIADDDSSKPSSISSSSSSSSTSSPSSSNPTIPPTAPSSSTQLLSSYRLFKLKYLILYGVIMLADWMQGTHMYTLYSNKPGVQAAGDGAVGTLFLTGFLSGALFAPFLGSFVDRYGRKRSCQLYCLLEIAINLIEHSDSFFLLRFGRVLGGVSTNLLFTAFESWMSTSHADQNFPNLWLGSTYEQMSVVNGIVAVIAGILAQLLEDKCGTIAPFQAAVALTALAGVLITVWWDENYGGGDGAESKLSGEKVTSVARESLPESRGTLAELSELYSQFKAAWALALSDLNVLRIVLVQALSEGAMYTFVFLWVPTLLSLAPQNVVPTGAVFSALMLAISTGGLLSPLVSNLWRSKGGETCPFAPEKSAAATYALAAFCMAVPAVCLSSKLGLGCVDSGESAAIECKKGLLGQALQCFIGAIALLSPASSAALSSALSSLNCFHLILASFLVVEAAIGMFGPCSAVLRSKHIPNQMSASVGNIIRLPLNAVVVLGTKASDSDWGKKEGRIFAVIAGCFAVSSVLQATMVGKKKAKKD